MTKQRPRSIFFGALAAALLFAAWRIYGSRAIARVPSHEGLDDPDVARAFNRIATMPQMRLLRSLAIRRAIALRPAGQAADLGSGPGHLVIELAHAAPDLHVTGIDLSDEMLDEAERRARQAGLQERIAFKKGDVAHLPFPDGTLDLVVSTLSLHHWSNPVGVMDEIARVLRPGGSFVLFDLRRDMPAPFYVFLWFVTHCIVPRPLRRVREPLGSRDAAFTLHEAADLAAQSQLTGWRVVAGPLWLFVEGTTAPAEAKATPLLGTAR